MAPIMHGLLATCDFLHHVELPGENSLLEGPVANVTLAIPSSAQLAIPCLLLYQVPLYALAD